ncbi:hypothetical protein SVAN01_05407 [Stagonosporopsis vannaccii]|nr:hypothetical protein SVAN01_05407 [Stagonosporopsis vannaccii]
MKYSLIAVSALSAVAAAAPASPAPVEDKSCVYGKPSASHPGNYQGCLTHNLEEYQYQLKCTWYHPEVKQCNNDDPDYDDDKVVSPFNFNPESADISNPFPYSPANLST